MLNRLLCYLGVHTGKFDKGSRIVDSDISKDGAKREKFFNRQRRYCAECEVLEIKDTQVGHSYSPSWVGKDVASNNP